MSIAAGVLLVILGLIAWGGQLLSTLSPGLAARLGLQESEENVEPVFHADARGEALWDTFTLWPLIVAGALLIGGSSNWAPFGLVGGAIYVYFGGRGILTRREMIKREFRVGEPKDVSTGLVMLGVWALAGLAALIAGWAEMM